MVDYDRLEEWLSIHLPASGSLEAIVIFTDTRPLDQIGAWCMAAHRATVAT